MSYFYNNVHGDHWNVTFFNNGSTQPLDSFPTKQEAIDHIHYLNGGEKNQDDMICVKPVDVESELKKLDGMPDFRRGRLLEGEVIDKIEELLLSNDTSMVICVCINDVIETFRETEHD